MQTVRLVRQAGGELSYELRTQAFATDGTERTSDWSEPSDRSPAIISLRSL